MQAKSHLSIIFVFILCLVFVVMYGLFSTAVRSEQFSNKNTARQADHNSQSYFTGVNFYILKNNFPSFHLESIDLTLNNLNKKTIFFRPSGVVYGKGGKRVFYEGRRGQYFANENMLFLKSEVVVRMEETLLKSDNLEYDLNADLVKANGDVYTRSKTESKLEDIDIWSDHLWAKPEKNLIDFTGNVKGEVKRYRKYEPPVKFKSSKLYMDLNKSHMTLSENVWLKKQEVIATSHKGEIFLKNYNKKLKYFVLYDDVSLKEKVFSGKKSFIRKAYGEKLEALVSEEKIILTGYPRVYQQKDVIKGNRIVLRENNEVVEVDDANTRFILR